MATERIQHVYAAATVLYAYPANKSLSLWATYRVLLAAGTSPDQTKYEADVDTAISGDWLIFVGITQPASWGDWIASWRARDAAVVLPATGTNVAESRKARALDTDVIYIHEAFSLSRTLTRAGVAVSLAGKSLVLTVEGENSANKLVIDGVGVVVSGAGSNIYTVVIPASMTATVQTLQYTLRNDDATSVVYDFGKLDVVWAPHRAPD